MDAYFPTTVHVEGCASGHKAGKKDDRVVGLWPGSSLHARKTLEFSRLETGSLGMERREHWGGWVMGGRGR
jgi:hypothetical protein